MKAVPFIDVHDQDLSPAIYKLIFTMVESVANDVVYECKPQEWICHTGYSIEKGAKLWAEQLARGTCCYWNTPAMEEFLKHPCTLNHAVEEFREFVGKSGFKKEWDNYENIYIGVWW